MAPPATPAAVEVEQGEVGTSLGPAVGTMLGELLGMKLGELLGPKLGEAMHL